MSQQHYIKIYPWNLFSDWSEINYFTFKNYTFPPDVSYIKDSTSKVGSSDSEKRNGSWKNGAWNQGGGVELKAW